jgi:hypothetical protein
MEKFNSIQYERISSFRSAMITNDFSDTGKIILQPTTKGITREITQDPKKRETKEVHDDFPTEKFMELPVRNSMRLPLLPTLRVVEEDAEKRILEQICYEITLLKICSVCSYQRTCRNKCRCCWRPICSSCFNSRDCSKDSCPRCKNWILISTRGPRYYCTIPLKAPFIMPMYRSSFRYLSDN